MVHDNATNNHGNRCQGSDSENKIDRVFRYTPPARTVLAICWKLIINAISTSNTVPSAMREPTTSSWDGDYAPINPPEWVAKPRPQVVLLSIAVGNREGWKW